MEKQYMLCVNNTDYENCMSIGWRYWVEIEDLGNGSFMYKFNDDNDEPLQSMVERFSPVELKRDDVIQVNPEVDKWGGCLLQVIEVCSWGVKCVLKIPYEGDAFMRINNGDFELVGDAPFMIQLEED